MPIFTLIANSGSLQKFDNSCTARIFSLHDFHTILEELKATADTGVPGTDEAGDEGRDNDNGGGSEDDTKSDTDMAE